MTHLLVSTDTNSIDFIADQPPVWVDGIWLFGSMKFPASIGAYYAAECDVAIDDFIPGKYRYDQGSIGPNPGFIPPIGMPAQTLPQLLVAAVTADPAHAERAVIAPDFSEVTCPAGTVLAVSAKLVDGAGATIPLNGAFRMPLIASDGRERIVGVSMAAGVAAINVPLAESGVWAVTEASINRDLPEAAQMTFAGIKVFVTL